MSKLITIYLAVSVLMAGCATSLLHTAAADEYEAPNRTFLLYQIASKVLEPRAEHANHDNFIRIEQLAVNKEVGCKVSILKQKASDQELSVIVYLWGSGKEVGKADAISKFGDATYMSAIDKYALASTTCMEKTNQLMGKLESIIEDSN